MLPGVAAEPSRSAEVFGVNLKGILLSSFIRSSSRSPEGSQPSPHLVSICGKRCVECKVRNWRQACRWLCTALVIVLGQSDGVGAGQVIGAIDIRGNTRTDSDIVQRELLFEPGDTLSATAVIESERILRRLLFLGRVHISSVAAAPGSVRVVVDVEDLYARALSPQLAGDIEEASYAIVAVDYNLFGRGQYARLTGFDDARSGHRATVHYGDPRLGGSHLRLATQVGWAEEGHALGLSLSQPFFALASSWAFGASAASHEARSRLYNRGTLVAMYADRIDVASAWLVHSSGDQLKVRPGVQVSVSDNTFVARSPYEYAPTPRRRVLTSLVFSLWRPRYVTDHFIKYLGTEEDFQVGSSASVHAGVSSRTLGSDRDYLFAAIALAPRFRSDSGWYLLTSFSARSRWHAGRYENLISTISARIYKRLTRLPGTPALAIRFNMDTLSRPEDRASQYLLGGASGLRGYLPRSYDGKRRLVTGFELRPVFLRRTNWALGGALFADAGGAWDSSAALCSAVGAGFRLGLPRVYDNPVLRVDVAHGLREGIWQFSFGLGQYF